jgi:hypothetical protein
MELELATVASELGQVNEPGVPSECPGMATASVHYPRHPRAWVFRMFSVLMIQPEPFIRLEL